MKRIGLTFRLQARPGSRFCLQLYIMGPACLSRAVSNEKGHSIFARRDCGCCTRDCSSLRGLRSRRFHNHLRQSQGIHLRVPVSHHKVSTFASPHPRIRGSATPAGQFSRPFRHRDCNRAGYPPSVRQFFIHSMISCGPFANKRTSGNGAVARWFHIAHFRHAVPERERWAACA